MKSDAKNLLIAAWALFILGFISFHYEYMMLGATFNILSMICSLKTIRIRITRDKNDKK